MKITIKKFKGLEDKTLSIPAEISGGNGIGKTTILEAISFVLTGKDLNGNEFKQLYDFRQDLHEAIADVEYTDDYGNTYRRIVSPVFETNRDGIERIKVKRNTVCKKNIITVNDYSDEFNDFYTLGTDYFFRQKEDAQRSIFIDAVKSKLPDYDVNGASLKKKELQKAHKEDLAEVKRLKNLIKETKDVPVNGISKELIDQHDQYLAIFNSRGDNQAAIAEINRKNNELFSAYRAEKNRLEGFVQSKTNLKNTFVNINNDNSLLISKLEKSVYTPILEELTDDLAELLAIESDKLFNAVYYEDIVQYAEKNFSKNPVLVDNQQKIVKIQSGELNESEAAINNNCPLNDSFCEVAKIHSQQSAILGIKAQNRAILQKEMSDANLNYLSIQSEVKRLSSELNNMVSRNSAVAGKNLTEKQIFDAEITTKISNLKDEIGRNVIEISNIEASIADYTEKINLLDEPTPFKLPEETEMPEDLKQARAMYEVEKEAQTIAIGINKNNELNKAHWESQIKVGQESLFELNTEITKLTAEISDYFSNLKNVVATEFPGKIEIGVELLEYVISKDEYKDCFRITANGKVFPYEINGALQNNTKLQILAGLQRLKTYNGVTVIDNCEANTTQPIDTNGLKCVVVYASHDQEIKIK